MYVLKVFALPADNLFTFSCQHREYIKSIILFKRGGRPTDDCTRKKQFREFQTAVKGILCTRLIYLRLKTIAFWAMSIDNHDTVSYLLALSLGLLVRSGTVKYTIHSMTSLESVRRELGTILVISNYLLPTYS